jgi:nucleotide-binding universal stress UspA family protein
MSWVRGVKPSREPSGQAVGGTMPVILVGLDGSPTSWDAFSWAAGEAVRANGRLIAVYVMPAVETFAVFGVPFDYTAADQARQARQEVAGQLEDEATQRARDVGVPFSFVSEFGDVAYALTSVARSVEADVVVVGRSAKLLHHLIGSLGRRLACRHDAPVVVIVP